MYKEEPMEAIYSNIADFILHFDRYLPVVMEAYGHWIYIFVHYCFL